MQLWVCTVQFGGRDIKKIEGNLMQAATGITVYAAEEGAEIKGMISRQKTEVAT